MDPTGITWVLVIWGFITLMPLAAAQLAFLLSPQSELTKEWLIGKDEDWRDRTHLRFSLGAAWADWLVTVPLFVAGVVGIVPAVGGGVAHRRLRRRGRGGGAGRGDLSRVRPGRRRPGG